MLKEVEEDSASIAERVRGVGRACSTGAGRDRAAFHAGEEGWRGMVGSTSTVGPSGIETDPPS